MEGWSTKIVVIGGAGLIGSRTVAILRQGGRNVAPESLESGVNTMTGGGLKQALADAQVVIEGLEHRSLKHDEPRYASLYKNPS